MSYVALQYITRAYSLSDNPLDAMYVAKYKIGRHGPNVRALEYYDIVKIPPWMVHERKEIDDMLYAAGTTMSKEEMKMFQFYMEVIHDTERGAQELAMKYWDPKYVSSFIKPITYAKVSSANRTVNGRALGHQTWLDVLVPIAGAMALFGGVYSLMVTLRNYCKRKELQIEAQSIQKGNMISRQKLQKRVDQRKKVIQSQTSGESYEAQFGIEDKNDKLYSNSIYQHKVCLYGQDINRGVVCDALISGRQVFTVAHVDYQVGGARYIAILDRQGGIQQQYQIDRKQKLKDRDGMCYFLPKTANSFKSFEKHLPSRGKPLEYECVRVHKIVYTKEGSSAMRTDNHYMKASKAKFCTSSIRTTFDPLDGHEESLQISEYYRVPQGAGKAGDCGKMFIAICPGSVDIMGFHAGTISGSGIVTPLWKEDIMIEGQGGDLWVHPTLKIDTGNIKDAPFIPGLEPIGKLPRRVYSPTETCYEASPIQSAMVNDGCVPVAPAVLTFTTFDNGKTYVDPWKNALKKFEEREMVTDFTGIEYATKHVDELLEGFCDFPEVPEPYTLEQVLFGDPEKGIDALPCDTSVTYEFKQQGFEVRSEPVEVVPTRKKKLWNRHTKEIAQELRLSIQLLLMAISMGIDIVSYSEACLKDELREWSRVLAGKTRMFFVSSLSVAILCCMYFKPIFDIMKRHMMSNPCKVGINPLGFDWHDLYRYIHELGPDFIFGSDCGGWDYGVLHFWTWFYGMWACNKYRVRPDSKLGKILMALAKTVVGCVFLHAGYAYQLLRGVSSGHYCTSNFNTFVNYMMHKIIFCALRPDVKMSFEQWVRFCAYGDDNLGGAHPDIKDWYNMLVLKKYFKEWFGMKYTTPGKEDVTSPFLKPDEISFLARKFRPIVHEGSVVSVAAPLDMDSIFGMLAWIRISKVGVTKEEQLQLNIKTALAEMSNYPQKDYERFCRQLYKWCRVSGVMCPVPASYDVEQERNIDQYHYVSSSAMRENWINEECMDMGSGDIPWVAPQ
jgi:hypothetical protein